MDPDKKLLLANKAWVQEKLKVQPDYFARRGHTAEFMWIGSSDSTVPSEEITGAEPGELFVHRNIGNLVVHTDLNLLSALQYAVFELKVSHVIVCGHYSCTGVRHAMGNQDLGILNEWLRHIKDIYRLYQRELESISDLNARRRRLVEINVAEQVQNLAETSIIQRAWQSSHRPVLLGWVYDAQTGYLKEFARMDPGSRIDDIYRFKFDEGGGRTDG